LSEWRSSTWGDEISLEYGKALRGYDASVGAYRVFGSNGPVGWTAQPLAPGPGIILGRKGAYRGVRYSREPFFVIDTAYYVVPKSELDMRWLYYAIVHHKLGEVDDGSPVPSTTRAAVYMLNLDVPTLPEQRAIAHILGALDNKIELNQRMSATVEAMTRALFKSWFVDFDPVRAKAEGRDAGLPKALADLFPARLVDSEIGEIPQGWEVGTLAEHFDAVKGVSYKGSGLSSSGMPLHNLNSINRGGGYKYDGIKYYTGAFSQRHLVGPGDVLVANTDLTQGRLVIGHAAIVPRAFGARGIASHHIYRLRPKAHSPLTATYLCHLLNSPQMHDIVSGYTNGTTVNMLPIDGVQTPKVVLAPAALVQMFDKFATQSEARREEAVTENRTLGALRDALLAKLISGDLRVKDAEKILARPS
jgi:type I restriction enzyme S subunit